MNDQQPSGEERLGATTRLHSITTTADRLGVAPITVRRMIRRGELHAVRVGRQWLMSEEAFQARFGNGR